MNPAHTGPIQLSDADQDRAECAGDGAGSAICQNDGPDMQQDKTEETDLHQTVYGGYQKVGHRGTLSVQ